MYVMSRVRSEIGNRYGKLTVVDIAEKEVTTTGNVRREAMWLCRCECGETKIVRGTSLRNGSVTDCGCIGRAVDLSGRTFGKWTVVKRIKPEGKNYTDTFFLCVCACGTEKVVPSSSLKRGQSLSCGCSYKLPKGEAAFRQLYSQVKYNAKYRGIEFSLSKEFFRWITKQPCCYCGVEPYQVHEHRRMNGSYIFNGIDRVDNEIGYIESNCVPCCGNCNYMKSAMPVGDFKNWIVTVYNHWASK